MLLTLSPPVNASPVPAWAQQQRTALHAMLLVGAWDPSSSNGEDAAVLTLLGSDHASVVSLCEAGMAAGVLQYERRRWVPLGESGQIWRWGDFKDAWRQLAPTLDNVACDRFTHACEAVLSGLGSETLRRGMVLSLALFGNSDGRIADTVKPSVRAAQIVEHVLPPEPERWNFLRNHLPLLAEAGPEAFLSCVERTLGQSSPDSVIWKDADTPALQSTARALGLLALDVNLLPRVTLLLAKLATLSDPPKANIIDAHPLQVLEEIFELQWPKTNATIEERLAALEALRLEVPETAWRLYTRLLHTAGTVVLSVPRPVAMRIAVPSRQRGVSAAAVYGQQETLLQWALALAGDDGERWAAIVNLGPQLFDDLLILVLRRLQNMDLQRLTNAQALWGTLRTLLSRFRPTPQQGDPTGHPEQHEERRKQKQIEALAYAAYERLTPSEFVDAHAWLFSSRAMMPTSYSSLEEHYTLRVQAQQQCVTTLSNQPDRWALLASLAAGVEDVSLLARQLAQSSWGAELEQQFPRLQSLGSPLAIWFLAWRVGAGEFPIIQSWMNLLVKDGQSADAALLADLVTGATATRDKQLWDLLDTLGDPTRSIYWGRVEVLRIALPMQGTSTARVLDHLMDAARWDAARMAASVFKEPASTAQRLQLLRRVREANRGGMNPQFSDGVYWVELWNKIKPQNTDETVQARQEEAAWLRALSHTHYKLRFVPIWMSDEPQAFVELANARSSEALLQLWLGWPGDTLPAEAAHEFLYQWAQAVMAHSRLLDDQDKVTNPLAMILARPLGQDNLWPGDALRRLLEEEHAQGESRLFAAVRRCRRDQPSPRAVRVTSHIEKTRKQVTECESSAQALAPRWPTSAALCHELAESYRQTAADWQERETMWNERDGLVGSPTKLEPLFPLTELQIENFRGIVHATLFPLHTRLNIVYGRNASGKSSVLDALRIGLAALVPKLPPDVGEKIGELPKIQDRDRHIDAESQKIATQVRITLAGQKQEDEPLVWQVERNYGRGAEAQDRETAVLEPYFEALNQRLGSGDPWVPLPVFAFYGAQRVPSAKAEETTIPTSERRTRADGLADALQGAASFEQGAAWFRREWVKELQERVEKPGYESPTLRAIRQALAATLMTPEGMGIKNPRCAKETLILTVDFVRPGQKDLKLEIGQLSDGFRTLLALVIDVVRRIAECSPLLENEPDPVERWRNTPVVVLIDEVDAHLHPSWQRTVLHGLLAALPRAQFFVTTHSPLVLAAEQDAAIWLLEDGKLSKVGQAYGKTPDVILEDYQDTRLRPNSLQAKLDAIREALQRGEFDGADSGIAELEAEVDPHLPELVTLRTRLHLLRDRAARSAAKQPA